MNAIPYCRFVVCEVMNLVNLCLQVDTPCCCVVGCGMEWFCMANHCLQIYLIDHLLGGEFSTYGLQVSPLSSISPSRCPPCPSPPPQVITFAMLDDEERADPMVRIFPKVTKCTFHNFGASGTIQQFDGLCILPINMINDKIYIGIWFWMFLLLVISIGFMIYR